MARDETLTDIPPYAKPLAPYIKTHHDALRIRQQLTAHLRSQILFREDSSDHPSSHAQSHLGLCVPQDAVVDVERIPPELTGLRSRYLEALQANVAARKKYQAVSEEVTSARLRGDCEGEKPADSDSELQAYLRLLRGRQRQEKAQVFQHYLEELKSRDVVGPEYFEDQMNASQPFALPERHDGERPNDQGEDIEELVHKLERAVIRAKSELEKEKKLFEEAKARYESEGEPEAVPSAVKARALQRTRDELVQWIEEKLVNMGGGDDDQTQELAPHELEDSAKLLDEHKVQIEGQYAAYVRARKTLLDTASKACQPVGGAPARPQPPVTHNDRTTSEQEPPLYPLDALAFAGDNLLPLSKSQRALGLQMSYLSGMLDKQKATALRMLNRLRDESHLLPEYPILARQSRLKHGGATLKSRRSSTGEPPKPDELISLAEAWAFASGAAGENEREYVEQKVAVGDETVQNAEKTLREVYDILNQDVEKRPKGPWARLGGQVDAG